MFKLFRKATNKATVDIAEENIAAYKTYTTAEFAAEFSQRTDDLQRARKSYEEAKAVSQKLLEFEVCL